MRCRDGSCVPLNYRCDGVPQCPDQSDELDCPSFELLENATRILSTNNCRGDDTVRCSDGSRDICSVQVCDGVPDCDDHGDERNCDGSSMIFFVYSIYYLLLFLYLNYFILLFESNITLFCNQLNVIVH